MESNEDIYLQLPDNSNILEDRGILFISGEISTETCIEVQSFILEQNIKNNVDHLEFYITSEGGSLHCALAIVDFMNISKIPVYTYGSGIVCSAALLILMAGKKGKRFLTPNTEILSHQYSWEVEGKHHELSTKQKLFERTNQSMIDLYKKFTRLSEKVIRKDLLPSHDVWLSAEEAIKYRIADSLYYR